MIGNENLKHVEFYYKTDEKMLDTFKNVAKSFSHTQHEYVMYNSQTYQLEKTYNKWKALSFKDVAKIANNVLNNEKFSIEQRGLILENFKIIKQKFQEKKLNWFFKFFFEKKKNDEINIAEKIISEADQKLKKEKNELEKEQEKVNNVEKTLEKKAEDLTNFVIKLNEEKVLDIQEIKNKLFFIQREFIEKLIQRKLIVDPKAKIKFTDCVKLKDNLMKDNLMKNKNYPLHLRAMWDTLELRLKELRKKVSEKKIGLNIDSFSAIDQLMEKNDVRIDQAIQFYKELDSYHWNQGINPLLTALAEIEEDLKKIPPNLIENIDELIIKK